MPQQVRETQRVPRSCIPCSRRKVKCSKKIPCEQCIRRGDAAGCIREVVRVGGKVTIAVDPGIGEQCADETNSDSSSILRENQSLKIRIKQLELALSHPELVKLEQPEIASPPAPKSPPKSSDNIMSDFQTQAFGLSMEPISKSNSTQRWDHSIKLILPCRRWSESIIDFSLIQLGWVHYAVDENAFRKEHDTFWDNLIESDRESPTDHGWIAVYLSLLAVGVYFMSEGELREIQLLYESFSHRAPSTISSIGKNPGDLAGIWYEAALKELSLADYTRRPAISTVQVVAILNLLHKNLGESTREYILHGMAVNVARLIGMDHLGEETSSPAIRSLSEEQLLVRQRLWWTLVICDWMTIWSRPVSINPDSFTTVMRALPTTEIEYHKIMARAAAMIRNHIASIKEGSKSALQACFEELDNLHACFPPPANNVDDDELSWSTLQHNLALNCVDSWRLTLYVAMLPQLLEDSLPNSHQALDSGMLTAKQILQRTFTNTNPLFHKFWPVNSAMVSAGIFLALDLICFQAQRPKAQVAEQKDLVALSFELTEHSAAETRHSGLLVLQRLADLYETVLPMYTKRVDRSALARIVKLVAFPRLWNSLTDVNATVRFIFQDSPRGFQSSSSSSSPNYSSSSPAVCPSYGSNSVESGLSFVNVPHAQNEIFDSWELSENMGQEEALPYFGQMFPSAEFIDASLLFADPTLINSLLRQ
ncbi:hypothetical protein N7456_011884 [Penicillium angulare]|uniref:Zn(2)-C6 fungal-type domain-containing protein n=1 Tax=Penicillium angulare TaxID=116970 RepID=A0A9W9EUM9_9EURO|nr:hypothetical protein N7456_011884 [Penicillium angulare]